MNTFFALSHFVFLCSSNATEPPAVPVQMDSLVNTVNIPVELNLFTLLEPMPSFPSLAEA